MEAGEDPQCVCTAPDLGSPAGRLLWLLGNTTLTTGDYDVTQVKLPRGAVSREDDGKVLTCRLDWAESRDVDLELNFACNNPGMTFAYRYT